MFYRLSVFNDYTYSDYKIYTIRILDHKTNNLIGLARYGESSDNDYVCISDMYKRLLNHAVGVNSKKNIELRKRVFI